MPVCSPAVHLLVSLAGCPSSHVAGRCRLASSFKVQPDADFGEVDPVLGEGKDPALGPDIIDGLRAVQDKIKDVREALNMYRIVKADGASAMKQLEMTPRQAPGGVPWANALDLEHVVEKTKFIPAADFDNLINGMHETQLTLAQTLKNYMTKKHAAHEAAKDTMREAAKAADDAALLMRGGNPDVAPPPEETAPPRESEEQLQENQEDIDDEEIEEPPPDPEEAAEVDTIADRREEALERQAEKEGISPAEIQKEAAEVAEQAPQQQCGPWPEVLALMPRTSWEKECPAQQPNGRRAAHGRFLARVPE
eukprot:TRINITY_DN92596_c0_g1_i1.p2 TRINITY_DN92596_c0_g1~~TRINITY_DN92596_c0_g1_i1.p2  ORF type:complete len:309 (-),score=91.97 TRINITY_DN92596_c0_g1_i1:88-1014(-)